MFRARQFLTILTSKPLSRAGVVQILATSWAADPPQLPFLGADFLSQRSDKTMENTAFRAIPTGQILTSDISAVSHLCDCISWLTDLQQQLSVWSEVRFQNFLDYYYTILYCTVLYCTILYYTILSYARLCYNILYNTILYYTIRYDQILYYTILYYTILYYTILYYTILD